ncbi:MAG: tRNA (adenine-N1)-methyltransferase [Dehalococcoidia bacterium]
MDPTETPRYIFREGEPALLLDRKGHRYLLTLKPGDTFHSHLGTLAHDDLIGQEEGSWLHTSGNHLVLALKPSLADYILEMPRTAQVIYPKDLGAILVLGDIFPGATVVEAGLGSGALTLALLRAVGERGCVVSYELRPELVERAKRNIASLLPNTHNLEVKLGSVYEAIEEREVDRVVLDVPEPWLVVPHAAEVLVPGGILLSFLPTVLQVHRLVEALRGQGQFQLIETVEVLLRPWHVTRRSVRPDHRMVAHTGFITTARRCAPAITRYFMTKPEPEEEQEEVPDGP